MSTVWRALCLDHQPPIWIDLFDGPSEARTVDRAGELLPQIQAEHDGCDLVLGGVSGGLVAFACPGDIPQCGHVRPIPTDAATLRLVLTVRRARIVANEHAGPLIDALARWNRNRCWPPVRLERLASELLP